MEEEEAGGGIPFAGVSWKEREREGMERRRKEDLKKEREPKGETKGEEEESQLMFQAKRMGWILCVMCYGILYSLLFIDLHTLSRKSKRRWSLMASLITCLFIFLLASFLMDRQFQLVQLNPVNTNTLNENNNNNTSRSSQSQDRLNNTPSLDLANNKLYEEFKKQIEQLIELNTKYNEDLIQSNKKEIEKSIESNKNQIEESSKNQIKELVESNKGLKQLFDASQKEFKLDRESLASVFKELKTIKGENELKDERNREKEKSIQSLMKQIDQIGLSFESERAGLEDIKNKIDQLNLLIENIKRENEEFKNRLSDDIPSSTAEEASPTEIHHHHQVSEDEIKKVIDRQLELVMAGDSTGLADYALSSAGAKVLQIGTSPTYIKATDSWWKSFFTPPPNPPSIILDPYMLVGRCWAFSGSRGQITIRLVDNIFPSSFSLDHPSSAILYGASTSAPKDFSVWVS
eukprot:TRINITY_DN2102_c0_g1_i3.p1 TRINITY_DN2102_c0_g1~~TRINITY_DN2102_c0_g1_i3.p1  ORF type:complete len:462 (-),score=126.38 TRINITY_DN2102_c0_g1_i3:276-1661(-)